MEKRKVDLYYGSLFHDIGKAVQRTTGLKKKHQLVGAEFLKPYMNEKPILNCLKYHHVNLRNDNLADDDLSYITYIADNIASGTDRRPNDEDVNYKWDAKTPLQDVFNRFGKHAGKRYLKPGELRLDDVHSIIPTDERHDYTHADYSRGVERFREGLMAIKPTEDYMQSALNLMEATMSFMPSSTNMEEVADISLYDHMKLTAAFAVAIQQYLDFVDEHNYKRRLYTGAQKFYKEMAFLMMGFKFTGLEKFIYTIVSQGAHKQLRSRAFYANMLSEWFIDTLLSDTELTRANVLFESAGQGYILLGNTPKNRRLIASHCEEFNEFLQEQFGAEIHVSVGTSQFMSLQVEKDNTFDSYSRIFKDIDREINRSELRQFDARQIMELNQQGKHAGRECVVCHAVASLNPETNKCKLCEKLESFSKNIQQDDFFVVNADEEGLPVGPGAFLSVTDKETIQKGAVSGRIYSKNQLNTGFKQQIYLWVGDYSDLTNNEFSKYADRDWTKEDNQSAVGIKRLAALRIDVDDLYAGFLAGFANQGDGMYTTISRYASLSRRLASFFNVHLNAFAEGCHATVIYSGGDDAFIIGAWDDILKLLARLRGYFADWTDQKMTFSAGIYMYQATMPINIVARRTNQLLQEAKLAGKHRVALFDSSMIFDVDEFINDVYYDKLVKIRQFFKKESNRGKSFAYKLLSLLRSRNEEDRISFARLAYFLSRLEDDAEDTEAFQQFKESMLGWYDNALEIKKVETALSLYIYEIRED